MNNISVEGAYIKKVNELKKTFKYRLATFKADVAEITEYDQIENDVLFEKTKQTLTYIFQWYVDVINDLKTYFGITTNKHPLMPTETEILQMAARICGN